MTSKPPSPGLPTHWTAFFDEDGMRPDRRMRCRPASEADRLLTIGR
jgi:hypothetical protein